jgi:peptidoglycan/LPS O-acetylase OafA/YrhL
LINRSLSTFALFAITDSSQDTAHRIASLDLLRGLAAFAVAISHYLIFSSVTAAVPETISVLAVEVFFILSGFVLAP